jgi:hypothetical protein
MGAFRTVWTALVSLYEETLVLLGGNLSALALNIPIALILFMLIHLFVPADSEFVADLSVPILGWLVPTPGNLALAGLTRVAAGPDLPRLLDFRESLRSRWKLAGRCTCVSLVVLCLLVWNVIFYVSLGSGWPLLVTIFWLYALLFWLSLHLYVIPLSVHVVEPGLVDLYRRAAFIALGHAGYTLVLLVLLLAIATAAVAFLPVYVLVATAFLSLAQAHALREIRRRHGDLVVDAESLEEEVSRP